MLEAGQSQERALADVAELGVVLRPPDDARIAPAARCYC